MPAQIVFQWLSHPMTRGLCVDDPRTTELRRQIIQKKPFLRRIYADWYTAIASAIPAGPQPALELGSGPGFLRQFVPGLITSDVFPCPDIDLVLDAAALPFADASLRAVVMCDVLHHIAAPRRLFLEAARCVRPGGALVMIEPWSTLWSRRVYGLLHREPFDVHSPEWEFPASGPLSGANGAMPWIIFRRDRHRFQQEFPQWQIHELRPFMPLRYLLSGGVEMRNLMPGFSTGFWKVVESMLDPWRDYLAMFAKIVLIRQGDPNHQ